MGTAVLIMGKSGTGKSTSLRNFGENVGIINVLGKPLPFRNQLKTAKTDDYAKISKIIRECEAQSIVIDDSGYLMTNAFMRGHAKAGAGSGIFGFYNDIGDSFWRLITLVTNEIPETKIVYFMMHEEQSEFGEIKPKAIGKLLDGKVCIEGMFTIVLRCVKEDGKHYFKTQSNGLDVSKTPIGMFEEPLIENDLKIVDDTIREYYK